LKVFTTVHFGFFLQKRALRFTSDQVVGHQVINKDFQEIK